MKTKIVLVIVAAMVVSGCIVRPAHRPHRVKVVAPVKTLVVLDAEHNDRNIVVVNAAPKKSRKCWSHRNHWHCRR